MKTATEEQFKHLHGKKEGNIFLLKKFFELIFQWHHGQT